MCTCVCVPCTRFRLRMSRLAQPGRWHSQRGLGVPLPPDADLPPAYNMGMEACSLAHLSLILFRHTSCLPGRIWELGGPQGAYTIK